MKKEIRTVVYDDELHIEAYQFEGCVSECRAEIEKACEFMEKNYTEHICLTQLCKYAAISKSTLLRAFTKSKGVTPYRYLENIRINEAKNY